MSEKTSNGIIDLPGLDNTIIDRIEQRDAFTDVIERMRSNMPFQHNLFEWYGAPGIGKTTLVRLLNNECEQRNVPWVLIDFESKENKKPDDYLSDPIKLVEEIVNTLSEHNYDVSFIKERISVYREESLPSEGICLAYARMSERERAHSESNPKWLVRMRYVISGLADIVTRPAAPSSSEQFFPIVLFIDGVDTLHELLTDWIEEFLVKPFVQSKRVIVVWTARNARKWKRPEIRWDRKSEELRTFSEDEVRLQLSHSPRIKRDENLAEQLFKNVYTLTGGHPYAGAVVIGKISQWDELNISVVKKREQELYKEIFQIVIQNYAFKNLTKEQRTALELCSMVRLIDTTTMQRILGESSGLFENWQRNNFDRLLLELRKTYLLRWEKSGWTIEPSIRHLMRSYYLTCSEEMFQKVNEAALKVYQDWLSKQVDNRKLFIIEEIYHFISLTQVNKKEKDIVAILKERLEEYPIPVKQDPDSWRITLEQIEGDIEHDDEILRITGETEVQKLTAPIKALLKQLKLSTEQIKD